MGGLPVQVPPPLLHACDFALLVPAACGVDSDTSHFTGVQRRLAQAEAGGGEGRGHRLPRRPGGGEGGGAAEGDAGAAAAAGQGARGAHADGGAGEEEA